MSNATSSYNFWVQDFPKAVITIGVLFGALIIGLIVSKIVDWCYDNHDVQDDSSDISEHTKELLRTQLELIRIGKKKAVKDSQKAKNSTAVSQEDERTTHAMNLWSNKVRNKADRLHKENVESADNAAFKSDDDSAKQCEAWNENELEGNKSKSAAAASSAVAAALDGDKPGSLPKPGSAKPPTPLPTASPKKATSCATPTSTQSPRPEQPATKRDRLASRDTVSSANKRFHTPDSRTSPRKASVSPSAGRTTAPPSRGVSATSPKTKK